MCEHTMRNYSSSRSNVISVLSQSHHSLAACPYSPRNLDGEDPLPDRLQVQFHHQQNYLHRQFTWRNNPRLIGLTPLREIICRALKETGLKRGWQGFRSSSSFLTSSYQHHHHPVKIIKTLHVIFILHDSFLLLFLPTNIIVHQHCTLYRASREASETAQRGISVQHEVSFSPA